MLAGTKNDDKIKAINEGVKVLEDFLEKFDKENRSKNNLAYLPSSVIKAFDSPKNALLKEFIAVYDGQARGNYKHLRTLFPKDDDSTSWDIIRNRELNKLKDKIAKNDLKLFRSDGSPTSDHLDLIHWAYSPQAEKVKALAGKDDRKRKSVKADSSSSDEEVQSRSAKKQKA